MKVTCPKCKGAGTSESGEKCSTCHGKKKVYK